MTKISTDMAKLLHQLIAQETGGEIGVRDEGLLDSALESAFATFDGKDLYPSKQEKAARIGYSLIANHAFIDGNKRIGMYIMMTFLELNGLPLSCEDEEIVATGLGVASGEIDYYKLLDWVNAHVA